MKNCDQFRELIEAYALGALDLEDRAALEAHLATGCPECAKAVEEARWLVSQLAYTAPEAAPSDMLKGRLMQTVRAEAEAQTKPRVMPAKSAIPFWLWAGVAALLVFSIYSAWNARQLQTEIREANSRAAALARRAPEKSSSNWLHAKLEAKILMDPSSVKIMLPGQRRQGTATGSQMAILNWASSSWEKRFRCPSPHHVLQLWFIPKAPGSQAHALDDELARCKWKTRDAGFKSAGIHGRNQGYCDH